MREPWPWPGLWVAAAEAVGVETGAAAVVAPDERYPATTHRPPPRSVALRLGSVSRQKSSSWPQSVEAELGMGAAGPLAAAAVPVAPAAVAVAVAARPRPK